MPLISRFRLLLLLVLGCLGNAALADTPELDWLELMPAADRQALEEMPEIVHNSPEHNGFSEQGALKQAKGLPAVMYSGKTVAALDGRQIRLSGYPVPLENDARGHSTRFFLVPYPGACIHVPPPPPNQIVLVQYPPGILLDDIYTPLQVEGTLAIQPVRNSLADAAYVLQARQLQVLSEALEPD